MGQLSDENLTTKAPARQVVTQRRPEVISEPVPPAARPAPPDLGEAVRTAVALGWQLSQLYADAEDSPDDDDADEAEPTVAAGQHIGTDPAARTPRAAPGSPSPALSPALPSMSRLPLHTQSELRVTQVLARVVRLQVQFGDRDGGVWPVTTLQRLQHERASNEAIRAAVPLLHEDLLRAMTWVDVRVAKAYSLGADLERYTRRPTHPARHSDRSDGPASLQGQVRPEVTRQIHRALRDLTTVLPDHAAETVTMSLLAWDRAVNAQRPTTERPKQSWPDTLHRQGARWRSLLTGETAAGDLVPLDAIVGSAVGSLWASRRLAVNALRSFAPVLVGIGALVGLVVLGVVLWPDAELAGKFVSVLVTLAAGAAGAWRAVSPRVVQAFQDYRDEILGASWNWAIAYEITPSPVRSYLATFEAWDALDEFLDNVRRQGRGKRR